MIVRPDADRDGSDCDDRDSTECACASASSLASARAGVDAINRIRRNGNAEISRMQNVAQPALEVVRWLLGHRPTPSAGPSDSANWYESRRSDASAREAWLFTVPTDEPMTEAICASDMSS
jgi:hypothetical protein